MASDVQFLVWRVNETEIEDFTIRDTPPLMPRQHGPFTVHLDNSSIDEGRKVFNNVTSRFVATAISGLHSGDQVECYDGSPGRNFTDSRTLNYYLMGKCSVAILAIVALDACLTY